MGYTHYFTQNKMVDNEAWDNICTDIRKVIASMSNSITVQSDTETEGFGFDSDAICNKDWINFNGVDDEGHETFYVPRHHSGFCFCKTNRKPYDLLVCSSLLIIHHYAPDCYDITSNGNQQDWVAAMELNARQLGYAYGLPHSIQDYNYDEFILGLDELVSHSHQRTQHVKINVDMLVQNLIESDHSVGFNDNEKSDEKIIHSENTDTVNNIPPITTIPTIKGSLSKRKNQRFNLGNRSTRK